jgi:molybdenum cofactor synthesis domain-containing protein
MPLIKVGILGLSQRVGRFNELGLRSWEESGCAEVERLLHAQSEEEIYYIHRPLVVRGGLANLQRLLREWCDAPDVSARCDLILTVAGTGLGPDDVMPEATQATIRRPLTGISDFVRHAGVVSRQPEAILSRGIAGIRQRTLIINLPGPRLELIGSAMELLAPLLPTFVQAVQDSVPK